MARLNRSVVFGSFASAFALFAPAAFAQEAQTSDEQGREIEEIVVTAQRRDESLVQVPVSITAISADSLAKQAISTERDLQIAVPGLTVRAAFSSDQLNYSLRGQTIDPFTYSQPGVVPYVNDYAVPAGYASAPIYDLQSIQVLKGPQGTLFGRNTTGGAINVIMRKPGTAFGGYAEVGYGSYNKKMVRASVDVPLAPTFGIKVSGYWQDDDGYVKNVTTGQRMNDDDGWGVRLGIRGDLSPSVRWNASFAHIEANGENILNFVCNPINPSDCSGRFATTGLLNGSTLSPSPFAADRKSVV